MATAVQEKRGEEQARVITHADQRRSIAAAIYTTAGWIQGSFRIPIIHTLADWLDHSGEFFKLMDVRLPRTHETVPFFALQRHAAVLVVPRVPLADPERSRFAGTLERHHVSVLFANGVVRGAIEVLTGVRVSDFLARWPSFIPVHDAIIAIEGDSEPLMTQPVPLIFVNAPKIVGFTELEI